MNDIANIVFPDQKYWETFFQNGLGVSAFSSPAWQRLMEMEANDNCKVKFLLGKNSKGSDMHLPVVICKKKWKRTQIFAQPISYFTTPVEDSDVDEATVMSIVESATNLFTTKFLWSLPPWSTWNPESHRKRTLSGILNVTKRMSYVITLNESAEEYFSKNVHATIRRYTRQNIKRGLDVITNPSIEQIQEYYELYSREFYEREWVGKKLSYQLFEKTASELGDGGELVLMRHKDKIVGGGILLYDKNAVHYFQGTIDRNAKEVRPMNALMYRALEQAETRGLKYFNLGGINEANDGLAKFKSSWGAKMTSSTLICWKSYLSI